jgi:hypothetical protein
MTLPKHFAEVVGDLYTVLCHNLFLVPRHHRATGPSTCGAARTLVEGDPILGTADAMMLFYLIWLVHQCFLAKSDLPDIFFPSTNEKGGQVHEGRY